ncbi:SLC24A2 [Symbiodinium sp. CCMP2592]|nr:SLC24A2 [Symbiodinium sp. CCMP2592]
MALIDSEASLKQRCLPIEGDDSLFESLKANGVKTLRQLAFALGSPQTPPSDHDLKNLAAKVYKCAEGTQPTIGQIANVRMLIFEASTLVVAQLRAQATADDSDLAGRKLPHVEKQARLTSQKSRLPGLLIEGELQPSYALVDACALMAESNSITWISPSRCTKRDAEVQQLGKEKTSLVQIEAGTLKVSASNKLPDADTTTALQLLYCFQRRGLALDQCSLIGWSDHEWYVQSLMSYPHGEPVSGARPAIAQVIRADREAWTLMSREIEGPIGVKDAAGELVMAAALRRLAKDPRVVVHLVTAPQPQRVAPPPSIPSDAAAAAALAEKANKKKKRKRLTNLVPESLKGCVTKIKATPAASSEASRASSDVESLAASILQMTGPFDQSSLLQLIELLPMQNPPRGNVGRSFGAGAYAQGGLYGLHSNTNLFPNVCAVFAAHLRRFAPGEFFTSFIILDDCSSEVHRDSNNDDCCCNILLKLSEFQGLNQSTAEKMRVRQDEDLEKATWQVRVIDDASICGINATVGLKYGFQMHSIDRYAAWISKALRINDGKLPACKGRVYDLKSAYKQFGIHPTDRELFRFAVNKPGEAEPMIMGANSLPFGAVGSVAAFLRISLSIWLIGMRLFSIFWTAFFDDFGVTTRDELVANTDSCICAIFDLLGVDFAREGKKAPPFSREFKLLGVKVDLNDEILSRHIYELQLEVNELRPQVQALRSQVQALEDSLSRVWVNQTGRFSSRLCSLLEGAVVKWGTKEVMINEERNLAVNKWLSLVMVEPLTFGVARNFYAGKASGISSGSLADSISDCLAAKATSTINARANCLLRFVSWAKGNMPFVFPLTEHAVYAYFEEKKSTAAATSFRSLLSSVAFAQHVVGLEGCDKVYTSGRVRGLASKLYMQKRKLKQRNPLRVSDVILLERICCKLEDRSLQDRIAAGFFLFLIYARARYSDGQNVASLNDSPLYLECSVGRSKTSFTLERKTRYLPMAARKVGIKCAWADAWLEALAEAGLAIKPNDPLLPCPSSNGSWKMIPLPCDQACSWLRSLLGNAQSDPYLANVGTHSLKRTLLSWASKRGLPREQRALLGYHTSRASGAGSELIYESDAQSAPLRALSSMIDEVSSGAFKPDKPRGQQLASELSAHADPPGDEIESSDSEGSEDEEEIDHSGDEACVAEALDWHGKVDLDKIDPSCVFFRHRQSRVVHITADEAGANLGCGRTISGQYRKLEVGLASADVEKLEKVGVDSLAKVAFMTSYTPGSGDDKDLIAAFESALGTPPSVRQKSSFRRLFHEAYAVTTSEMKMLVERTDESIPRKLSVPERSERFEVVSKRLVGLSIKNRLEPADSLVDSFVSQYEQDKLQFVPWEKLVSKEQEASTGAKREPFFSLDSTGKLRSETKVEVRADTSTELLLQLALQRRGIAMEMANILDYHRHHMWVERLLAARLDAPPSTHMQPTLDQCQQADRKLWQLLGEATRSGIQLKAGGRPLDTIFEDTWQSPEVLHLLQPMPRAAGASVTQQVAPPPRPHGPGPYDRPGKGRKGTGKGAKGTKGSGKVPDFVLRLNSVFKELLPQASWNAICVGRNTLSDFHRDSGNQAGSLNHTFTLGTFTGGQLWLEDASGTSQATVAGDKHIRGKIVVGNPPRCSHWVFRVLLLPQRNSSLRLFSLFCQSRVHEKPLFLEICSGSAMLSYVAKEAGYTAVPIDWHHNKQRACVHTLQLDLRLASTWSFLRRICSEYDVAWVHMARVDSANTIYDSMAAFCDWWAELVAKHSFVTFDSCRHGRRAIPNFFVKGLSHAWIGQVQPRGRKFPPIISEFAYTMSVASAAAPTLNSKHCLSASWQGVPAGAKLLRESVERGGSRLPEGNKFYTFGVYRSMQAFLNEAKLVVHPFDSAKSLPDELLRVLFDTLTKSPVDTMKHRLLKLQQWRALAKQLDPDEEKIRSAMDPCVRKVLGCKRIALMKRIAADLSWPDTALFDDLAAGFKLTGYLGRTGVFASDVKPATMDLDDFWASAPLRRETLLEKVRAQKDHDYAEELWNMTLEESNRSGKCWLDGPIDVDSLGDNFPEGWNACRRFAVWQGKWRAIDDFSEAAVNSCFGCFERVTLKALDEICWLCMQVCRAAKSSGSLDLELSTGERLKGPLHKAWKDPDRVRPHCKTYDLQAAYKQLALHPSERPKSIILLKEPGSRAVKAFVCNTLPFGASASVMQFNRVALFLQRVLWDLRVAVTCYYDDFPTMTPSFLSGGTDNAVHALMDLFGFSLSEKEKPFSCTAETLGVVLDTSDPDMGRIFVSNKPERAAMLEQSLGRILEKGQVDTRELPSLLGKLRFADAQLLGRTGRLALADLRLFGDRGGVLNLTDTQSNALAVLRARLLASRPRAIVTSPASNPVLIFTDGACDPCEGSFSTGVGGVLFVPGEGVARAFGCRVPSKLVRQWAEGRKHIIGQVELYAVVLARILWSSYIDGERCIFFVDHSGVLSACINSNSIDASWRSLLLHLEAADEARPCLPWFHRVPSQSNIADPPSRGRWEELAFLGPVTRDVPTCFVTGATLEATIGNTAERREELSVFIESILSANCLDLKTAERLRGRLVFFEGFVFGRMSNSSIRTVDRAARAGLTTKSLPEDVRKSLVVIRERLRVAEPVTIATKNHQSWIIFTDGACEGGKKLGSIGGVIVGLNGRPISFFSEQVPQDIMRILLRDSQNPIFELELLPVLLAYRLWGQWCRFSQAVFYVDNEGARHSIIAAGGGAALARVIIDGILSKETSLQIHAWYARVPTHSNIADSPSRGEYEGLLNIGCSRLRVDWDAVARQYFPLG